MPARLGALLVALVAAACSGAASDEGVQTAERETAAPASTALQPSVPADSFGAPPPVRDGPLDPGLEADLESIFSGLEAGLDRAALRRLGSSGDARVSWLISDLLRFVQTGEVVEELQRGFTQLTGATLEGEDQQPGRSWKVITDHLIAWDLPAPPGYVDYKARLFTLVEPGWAPFFGDPDAEIDWRLVSWGGVLIDDRPLGERSPCPRGCIPALDDPPVTGAAGGSWYPDDALVFALVVNGESRAYPKNVMEVHEMVNDTVGGRRIGMPYCTLCGSAQAYFTDTTGGEDLVLRTSGLLSRSNKVMYELRSKSVFDTFTGRAVSGPLQDAGTVLEQVTVVTTTWGEWKAAHPETTIVARGAGLGIEYPADPLRGRDDEGPIFPIGDADPRLPVHEPVVGVIAEDGTPVAFPVASVRSALASGETVELAGVRLELDGGGLRATLSSGGEVVSHQAFWFAWSQFHPGTAVWTPLAG